MTACLYLSPPRNVGELLSPVVPVLLADTLVTWKARHLEGAIKRTPSNTVSQTSQALSSVSLTRKLHLISSDKETAAVAFAGEAVSIRECLHTLIWNLENWETNDRPMRNLADNVNLYAGKVECIGVYSPKVGNFNSVSKAPAFELANLGLCAVIGSGERELEAWVRAADAGFRSTPDIYENIHRLAESINGVRLASEIANNSSHGWGGYVEYLYYDDRTGSWSRGPRSLHLFYQMDVVNGFGTVTLLTRTVAYDPDEKEGRILSIVQENDHLQFFNEFRLVGDSKIPIRQFWTGWSPDRVTLNFHIISAKNSSYFSSGVLREDMGNVIFSVEEEGARFGLTQSYLDRILEFVVNGLRAKAA